MGRAAARTGVRASPLGDLLPPGAKDLIGLRDDASAGDAVADGLGTLLLAAGAAHGLGAAGDWAREGLAGRYLASVDETMAGKPAAEAAWPSAMGKGMASVRDAVAAELGTAAQGLSPNSFDSTQARPYGEMKKGVNLKLASSPDLDQFVQPDGRLFATLVRGDRTGIDDFVHPDGTVTKQFGGPDGAWLLGNEGFVWTSKTKPVDTRIHSSLDKAGGLAIVRIGAEDQSLSSGAARVYADAMRAAQNLGYTPQDTIVDHLRDAFQRVGVPEELLPQSADQGLAMLASKGFVPLSRLANFPASKAVVEHLAQPRVSKSLGIPDRATMLQGINARRFQGLPSESVVSAFYGDPAIRVSPKLGEPGWHPDYDHAVRGIHLGDFSNPLTLAELAPKELRNWMEDETTAYRNFDSLMPLDQANILGRVRKLSTKNYKKSRRAVAAEYGFTDIRGRPPTVGDWYSSLRDSNRPIELDLRALRQAIQK